MPIPLPAATQHPLERRWLVAYYRLWAFPAGVLVLLCWLGVGVWGLVSGHLALGLVMVLIGVLLGLALGCERRRLLRNIDR